MATFCFYPNRSLDSSGSFSIAKMALFCKFVILLSLARNWVEDAFGNFPEKRVSSLKPADRCRKHGLPRFPLMGSLPSFPGNKKEKKL